jgi:hypothetical protein
VSPPGFCDICGRPEPCPFVEHSNDPDDYDRNGVVAADGQVYSDADPGL